jgi:hypothetical protein
MPVSFGFDLHREKSNRDVFSDSSLRRMSALPNEVFSRFQSLREWDLPRPLQSRRGRRIHTLLLLRKNRFFQELAIEQTATVSRHDASVCARLRFTPRGLADCERTTVWLSR